MRRFVFAAVVLLALAPCQSRAADAWSGAYAGVNFGGAWSSADWRNAASSPLASFFDYAPGQGFSNDLAGVIGGAQVGINFQRGPWVLGIEAMLDASDIDGDFTSNLPAGAADDKFEAQIEALFLATARVGYAWDNWLVYGKAGYAAARINLSVSDSTPPNTGSGNDSQWHSGPVAGIGVEYRLTPQLSLAAEYNHVWLDSGSYQLGGGTGNYSWDVDIGGINILMARLNWRFASF
jgi:outer membrane immunogenic protein